MTTHTTQREADERALFEAWFVAALRKTYPHMPEAGVQRMLSKHEDGNYADLTTQHDWSVWQASVVRAAIAQGASPAPLALPTNDEVFAEVNRLRDAVSNSRYVSTNAVNDTMQAVRSLLASTRAAPEAPTLPRALREVRKQQIDPKLGTNGATAYERFLYAELARLQAAVIADCESAGAAPEAPTDPRLIALAEANQQLEESKQNRIDHARRLGIAPEAPDSEQQAQLIVSTAAGADRLAVLVSVKRGDITTVVYSRYHSMNGDSVGVESISSHMIDTPAATTASTASTSMIETWQERKAEQRFAYPDTDHMLAEIADLRAALAATEKGPTT